MKHNLILSIMVFTTATLCTAQETPRETKLLTGPSRIISSQPAPSNTCSALGLNFIIALQGVIADPNIGADQLLGEIRLIAGDVAPKGWALCHGQIMAIKYHVELFKVLGTRFGGDGKNTFALPNLKDAVPVGIGENWTPGKKAQIE